MSNAKRISKGKIVLIVVGILLVLGIIGVATTPTAQVPDVSGQSGTEAEQTLKSQGFNTINFQSNDSFSTVANDIMKVSSQDPAAGQDLATSTAVTLKGDTYTDYFKAFEYRPISEWGDEPSNHGFTCKVLSSTGMELNNDLAQIAETSTGERWCATLIEVDAENKVLTIEVDSFEHLNSYLEQ